MSDHAAALDAIRSDMAPIPDGPFTFGDCRRFAQAIVSGIRGEDEPTRVELVASCIYYLTGKRAGVVGDFGHYSVATYYPKQSAAFDVVGDDK